MDCYIDCMVSLDCGEVLGTYQGQVDSIDPLLNTITLKNTFRNGVPYRPTCITIRSQDILSLEIVKSSQEAQDTSAIVVPKFVVPSSNLSELISTSPSPPNYTLYPTHVNEDKKNLIPEYLPGKSLMDESLYFEVKDKRNYKNNSHNLYNPIQENNGHKNLKEELKVKSLIQGLQDRKFDQLMQKLHDSFDRFNTNDINVISKKHNVINNCNKKPRSITPPVLSSLFANASKYGPISLNTNNDNHCYRSLDDDYFAMNNSKHDDHFNNSFLTDNINYPNYKYSNDAEFYMRKRTASETCSPKRSFQGIFAYTDDCFKSAHEYNMDEEFDFEMNLAMFDKDSVYKEIERKNGFKILEKGSRGHRGPDLKFKNTENILKVSKPATKHIDICPLLDSGDYVTDEGLIVPSVSPTLKSNLLTATLKYGIMLPQIIESFSRSLLDVIVQLLGGANRFDTKNAHQRPNVLLLIRHTWHSAAIVNLARYLLNRDVIVLLLMTPDLVTKLSMHEAGKNGIKTDAIMALLKNELHIYEGCGGKILNDVKAIPSLTFDMVISSIDCSSHTLNPQWTSDILNFIRKNRFLVTSIEPGELGPIVESKCSFYAGLPLVYKNICGRVYLCDVGVPIKAFKDIGISTYQSPFSSKFVIALNRS